MEKLRYYVSIKLKSWKTTTTTTTKTKTNKTEQKLMLNIFASI